MTGDGMSASALALLAVVESLLPSGTFHVGPPSCLFFYDICVTNFNK